MPFSESFDCCLQIAGFTKRISVQLLDHGVSIDQTDRYLGTEFDIGSHLTPDNRSYPRLVDADNPVVDFVFPFLVHLQLLAIDSLNGLPVLLVPGLHLTVAPGDHLFDQIQISVDKTQLFTDRTANLFVTRFAVAGKSQV